ncbi:MAG: zinc ribbon domain-containing protein [Planctomycetaceae bacterium]|nr:zinc ribbon domain-containing protein [Planctomycetaceae bacterium]
MSYSPSFCTVCGTSLSSNVKFCPNCGAPITKPQQGAYVPQQGTPQQGIPVASVPQQGAYVPYSSAQQVVPYPEQLSIYCPTLPKGAFRSCVTGWLIYVVLTILCMITLVVAAVAMDEGGVPEEVGICLVLGGIFGTLAFVILGVISYCKFLYRCWRLIQDGHARTTPGKAVGFLFIPFFNIYWFFVAHYGLAIDLNSYARRYQIAVPRAPEGLVLTALILLFIPYLNMISIFFWIPALFSLAKTAEAIQDARRP